MELSIKLTPSQAQELLDIVNKAIAGYDNHLENLQTIVPELIPYYQHRKNTLFKIQSLLAVEMIGNGIMKKSNIELYSEFVENQTK